MKKITEDHPVSLEKRQELIKTFPCFANLSEVQCKELAILMHEISYAPREKIVNEGELVDSIYIIVKGAAEVTKRINYHLKMISIPVAILTAGEAIGLNETGFYSSTGKRTASVIANNRVHALKLDVQDLYQFLKHHHLESSMYKASVQMMRIRLIKQSLPFSRVSHERLQWLADQIEDITLPAGTVLFKQGEIGDKSYLIRSGEVAIDVLDEQQEVRRLALLKPPTLFGEATLITQSPRNATATLTEDSELLVLEHKYLSELIESERNISSTFMSLTVDRSRPLQNSHVIVHHQITEDGEKIIILKNSQNDNYFKLSNEGYYIWQLLDGNHTVQDITLALADEYQVFAPNVVVALISKLMKGGFIANYNLHDKTILSRPSLWKRKLAFIRKIFSVKFIFRDTDKSLDRLYQKIIRYLFTRLGQTILGIVIIAGFVSFVMHSDIIITYLLKKHVSYWIFFLLIPFSLVRIIFHELGHAFAVKAFGRDVNCMGIGWIGTGPVAFIDTSEMWLANRRARIIVSLAGVYADLLTAGIFSLWMVHVSGIYSQSVIWLFAMYTYIGAFSKLSPLQESDGYYAVMDFLDKPRLQHSAVTWLVKELPYIFRRPRVIKGHGAEIYYWLICLAYLIIISLLTYFVQAFITKVLDLPTLNIYVSLIIPFLVIILSSLKIINEVKHQIEE